MLLGAFDNENDLFRRLEEKDRISGTNNLPIPTDPAEIRSNGAVRLWRSQDWTRATWRGYYAVRVPRARGVDVRWMGACS